MRDKIISGIIGAIIGGIIVFGYGYFISGSQNNNFGASNQMGAGGNAGPGMNFDASNMSDEQLEKMAERSGVTTEELKEKLESGEDMRGSRGDRQERSGRVNNNTEELPGEKTDKNSEDLY